MKVAKGEQTNNSKNSERIKGRKKSEITDHILAKREPEKPSDHYDVGELEERKLKESISAEEDAAMQVVKDIEKEMAKENEKAVLTEIEKFKLTPLGTTRASDVPLVAVIASNMAGQYFTEHYSKMRSRLSEEIVRETMRDIVRYSVFLVEEIEKVLK